MPSGPRHAGSPRTPPGIPASPGSLPGLDHVPSLEALEPVTEDVALGLWDTGGGHKRGAQRPTSLGPCHLPVDKDPIGPTLAGAGCQPRSCVSAGFGGHRKELVTEWARPGGQGVQWGRSQGRRVGRAGAPEVLSGEETRSILSSRAGRVTRSCDDPAGA